MENRTRYRPLIGVVHGHGYDHHAAPDCVGTLAPEVVLLIEIE